MRPAWKAAFPVRPWEGRTAMERRPYHAAATERAALPGWRRDACCYAISSGFSIKSIRLM